MSASIVPSTKAAIPLSATSAIPRNVRFSRREDAHKLVDNAAEAVLANAIIMDCWGGSQRVCERANGGWQLATGDGPVAEFLPA
jgi:hypothetical protein